MVRKIGKSRRYEPLPEGVRSLTTLLVPREEVIRPLLAASNRPEPQSKTHQSSTDRPTTTKRFEPACETCSVC
jgi:hypothetical protein